MKNKLNIIVACLMAGLFLFTLKAKGEDMVIHEGSSVKFDYTLMVDGEIIDSSKDRGPFQYVHGKGQIIPGLASQLEGLKAGDEKEIAVLPKDGYGEINPKAFQDFPKSAMPKDFEPKADVYLQLQSPNGQVFPARIVEVKEQAVAIDLNHPLAGKTLIFQVKIISVE